MAGILDTKKRIMDTIVTQEGRRQLSSGNFKIKYASFTDGNVFYEEDLLLGTTDATLRIPFETVNKFQDNIVFETDDSGNLMSFKGNGIELTDEGSIAIYDETLSDPSSIRSIVTGSDKFSSSVDEITNASFDSFNDQNFISTKSYNNPNIKFKINQEESELNYTLNSGLSNEITLDKTLDTLPSFVHDKKLSNVLNFKFLPPINHNDKSNNGEFKDLNEGHFLTDSEVLDMITNKEKISCSIEGGSRESNILLQVFEENLENLSVKKLDTIDFGTIKNKDDEFSRIIFVGKVLYDSFDQPTFMNIFTLEIRK